MANGGDDYRKRMTTFTGASNSPPPPGPGASNFGGTNIMNYSQTSFNIKDCQNLMIGQFHQNVFPQGYQPAAAPSYGPAPDRPADNPRFKRPPMQPEKVDVGHLLDSVRNIDEIHFQHICTRVGAHWRRLGRTLSISDAELENLHTDYKDDGICEVIIQVLLKWQRRMGSQASFQRLAHVFRDMEREDLVQDLARILQRWEEEHPDASTD